MSLSSEPVRRAGPQFLIEFALATALYVAAILLRDWSLAHRGGAVPVALARLLTVVPVWLMLLAPLRYYWRIDEYAKVRLLKTVALGFGIGSAALVSCALLTEWGLPQLALSWAVPTLAAGWAITTALMDIEAR